MSKQIFYVLRFVMINILISCNYRMEQYPSPPQYDLNHPLTVDLPGELNEISGILYYAKDSSIFAISDATGWLYKIFPYRKVTVQKWKFGKNHDYEDLQLVDSTFYILSSSGDIMKLKFSPADSLHVEEFVFPENQKNEFESLYYDNEAGVLNMICKNCKHDKKNEVNIWSFNLSTQTFALSPLTIDVGILAKEFDKKKLELKPSAAAIDPLTNELYILSSVNKLLLIADKTGKIKKAYPLNPAIYKQPEGIAFTRSGDLLISNESAKEGLANIQVMKYKKKAQ